jgi:ABC-type nitrate/sulfonate/bicarbonate transport system permease component
MIRRLNYKPLVVVAILVLAWQWGTGDGRLISNTLAPPVPVAAAMFRMIFDGSVIVAGAQTLLAALLGLILGGGIGLAIGLGGGMVRAVAAVLRGPVEVLRPLPAIALVPLMTITFGLGLAMEVYVVAFAVVWPCIILTQHAVQNVDRRLIEVADVLELGQLARIRKIILPAIWPRLIIMVRFSAAIALLIAVTVELVSNPWGLGHAMMVSEEGFEPAKMLAYLVVITLIGWGLNWALVNVERRFAAFRIVEK